MSSGSLDFLGEGFACESVGALEDHVFEKVGDAGTGEGGFVLGAGADPDLSGDDGGVRSGVEDGVEIVIESLDGG